MGETGSNVGTGSSQYGVYRAGLRELAKDERMHSENFYFVPRGFVNSDGDAISKAIMLIEVI